MAKNNGKKPRPAAFRTKATDRRRGFKKIRMLKCFDELHSRICEGWTPRVLATWVQEEQKEYTDVSHEGLTSLIRRYRDSLPPAELVKNGMPRYMDIAKERLDEGMNELDELWDLYALQKKRLQIEFENEQTVRKLFPTMTQEIRATREVLSTIAQLKMDLGLNDRHLGTVDVDAHITAHVDGKYSDPTVAKVLSDPVKRQKLLGIAKRITKRVDKPVIEAEAEVVVREDEGEGLQETGA